jgi:hypothetical protein
MVFWILYGIHEPLLATHIIGGFISATLTNNNTLTYRIALNSFFDAGSTVLFGGGLKDFGDGSNPAPFESGNPDFSKLLDEVVAMDIFEVDHSFPGPGAYTIGYREFNRIAALPENNMEFMDENVISNRDYYYRVKAMGTEGSANSKVLEVKEQDIITGMKDLVTDSEIILYPIPAEDQLFIYTYRIIQWPAVIEVLDLNGRILQQTNLSQSLNSTQIVIPIPDLIPGLYILQTNSVNFTFRQKFVKD